MSFKIRFNLGKGKNFEKWRVTNNRTKESYYFDPNKVTFQLVDCKLRNQKGAANKIHQGANKTVCAWIDCEDILALPSRKIEGDLIKYNPRETPNWTNDGVNVDGAQYEKLFTQGRNIIWKRS